jgi:hypothetical protein
MKEYTYIEEHPTFSLIGNVLFITICLLFDKFGLNTALFQKIKAFNLELLNIELLPLFYGKFTELFFFSILLIFALLVFYILFFKSLNFLLIFLKSKYKFKDKFELKGKFLFLLISLFLVILFFNPFSILIFTIITSVMLVRQSKNNIDDI